MLQVELWKQQALLRETVSPKWMCQIKEWLLKLVECVWERKIAGLNVKKSNEIEFCERKGNVSENIVESCTVSNFKIIDIVVKFCQT